MSAIVSAAVLATVAVGVFGRRVGTIEAAGPETGECEFAMLKKLQETST